MKNMELRFRDASFEAEDGTLRVSGYVNKTGQLSNVLGSAKKFVEKIAKGAFDRSIRSHQNEIDFLAEHNNKKILSSTRNGSLTLKEDDYGLFMSAEISPTSWGNDYFTLIRSGILRNMSFGFRTVKDSWRTLENGIYERTIEDLELFEVSVVRDPAYSQSTIAARGIELIEDVDIPINQMEEKRLMENFEEEIVKVLEALKAQLDQVQEDIQAIKSNDADPAEDRADEEDEEDQEEEEKEEDRTDDDEKDSEDRADEEKDEDEKEESEDESDEKDEDKEKEEEDRSADVDKLKEFRDRLAALR